MVQTEALVTGRLPHACLLCAPAHEDALREARRMAAAAVCSGAGEKPCGLCRDCRKADAGIHPDIVTVQRLRDDKGRPRPFITVDQIRALAADAIVLPNEAARKVYILDEAETMNPAAQNAALKLLEEPPSAVLFLLCTVNPLLLLPTVRSRCAQLRLGGREAEAPEDSRALAEGYLGAVCAGERAALLRWCSANEGMDGRTAMAFAGEVRGLIADMLCRRRDDGGLARAELLRLSELMERCTQYLKVNTGVRQIFGLLAVDSLPAAENRG